MTEAERRAYNRGLEEAARIAEFWMQENFRLCNDTILLDPLLNGRSTPATLAVDLDRSKELGNEGHAYATAGHACKGLAEMIRQHKVKANVR